MISEADFGQERSFLEYGVFIPLAQWTLPSVGCVRSHYDLKPL